MGIIKDPSGHEYYPPHRSWWRNNWIAFAMFASVLLTNIWNGTDWLHARASEELVTRADIARIEQQLNAIQANYVRQDVFTEVLLDIRAQLARIEAAQVRLQDRR